MRNRYFIPAWIVWTMVWGGMGELARNRLHAQSYPSSIYTPLVAKDNIQTTLSQAMAAGDTTAFVASTTSWAANMVAYICDTSSGNRCTGTFEAMLVTAVPSANALTVTRHYGGTSAYAHTSGKAVLNAPTAVYNTTLSNEVLAIETALGTNLSNVTGSVPYALNSANYNFAAQTCALSGVCIAGGTSGMSLVIGANVLTMTPCPLGVSGAHTVAGNLPHLLYVSGGTGTAEAAPIAGGTCTSGLASGTIILSTAGTHMGAWTVKSNTTGLQEAVYVAGAAGAVRMPAGAIDLWANTASLAAFTVPDGYSTSVRGQGIGATTLRTHGTTRDWMVWDYVSSGGFIDAGDFSLVDDSGTPHTTGKMMWTRYRQDGNVSGVYIDKGYDNLWVEANRRATYHALTLGTSHYGLYITCNGAHLATCVSTGTYSDIEISSATSGGDALRIQTPTAGLVFDNVILGAASNTSNNAIHIVPSTDVNDPMNEILFTNPIVDGHSVGIRVTGNGASFNGNSIQVIGGRVNSGQYNVVLEAYVSGFSTNGTILTGGINGVGVDRAVWMDGQVQHAAFLNSPQIGTDGDTCFLNTGTVTDLTIRGNNCGRYAVVQPLYGIWNQGSIVGLHLEGNLFDVGTILNNSGTLSAPQVWANNLGIDNVIPAVASAATLAFPLNPIFTLSGSTNVTAVTFPLGAGAIGAHGTLTATAATLTFTLGASIGNSFILKQNVPASWNWDGTKVWLSGQDPALSRSANYIATESGSNNAIIGDLTGVPTIAGVTVTIKLAHTLQAGANTFNFNSGGAVNIKSSRNTANNIGTAYAVTGIVTLTYDGAVWLDVSQ